MEKASTNEKASISRKTVRFGRPPRELAGEVEERILDAACKVFLERGFEGASIEEIADVARAGKPTIYARFPNKDALFAAAIARRHAKKNERIESYVPAGATVEERLTSIGVMLLREMLTSEWIGLIRLAIAETHRFPDLADSICRTARERGTKTMARLLGDVAEAGGLGSLPAFGPERSAVAAQYFVELTLLPMLLRALAGEKLEALHDQIEPRVSQRMAFFLAGCRHGGIQ